MNWKNVLMQVLDATAELEGTWFHEHVFPPEIAEQIRQEYDAWRAVQVPCTCHLFNDPTWEEIFCTIHGLITREAHEILVKSGEHVVMTCRWRLK